MWNLVRNSFTGKALCTAISSWWRINLAWGVVIFCLFQTSHFYVEYLVHSQILRNKFWMNISLKVRNMKVTKKELRMFTLLILTFSGLGESGQLIDKSDCLISGWYWKTQISLLMMAHLKNFFSVLKSVKVSKFSSTSTFDHEKKFWPLSHKPSCFKFSFNIYHIIAFAMTFFCELEIVLSLLQNGHGIQNIFIFYVRWSQKIFCWTTWKLLSVLADYSIFCLLQFLCSMR